MNTRIPNQEVDAEMKRWRVLLAGTILVSIWLSERLRDALRAADVSGFKFVEVPVF
jgi:hypothetical protein